MANTVIALKKSATPSSVPSNLANGELAINYADGKLYYKAANGTIASISGNEPNYFGTVNANNTLVVADTPGDVFTIEAGENITIIGDAINDKITISASVPSSGDPTYAFNQANIAYAQANAAYDAANNAVTDFSPAFIQANTAYNAANTADDKAEAAFIQANAARSHANASYAFANSIGITANSALPNTDGVTFNGSLRISQNLVASKVIIPNNGNAENLKLGDDVWLGDYNTANSLKIKGTQNSQIAYISFGTGDSKALGRAGTDQLTYDNNIIWHQGNDGTGSGLDADLLDGYHGTHYAIADDLTAAFAKVNIAFARANTTNITADRAWNHANAAFITANIAFANANTVMISAQAAFTVANSGFLHANAAFAFSNSAHAIANLAFTHANAAFTAANTAGVEAEFAFLRANLAHAHANAAFASSNSVNTYSISTYLKLSAPSQTITGNVNIVGDLTLSGNTVFIDATRLQIDDPLIYLAGNNYTSDIVDIGFIANYVNATGQNVHTGLYREHENKEYYLFQGYDSEPINNHIGAFSNNMTLAVLNADLKTSNLILGGANAIVTIGAAFTAANTAGVEAEFAFLRANLAHAHANASYAFGNSAHSIANLAFTHANAAFASSNADYAFSNSAHSIANLAFTHANAAFTAANVAGVEAEYAFLRANLAHAHANASYAFSNSAHSIANLAFTHANGAFNRANSALANTAGISTAGGLVVPGILTANSGAGTLQIRAGGGNDHTYIEYYPRSNTGSRGAYVGYGGAATNNFTIMNETTTGTLVLGTAGAADLVISAAGTVGIGGSGTPSNTLHVFGTANISGTLKSAGLYDSTNRLLLIRDSTGTVVWGN